jgi:hypothetical protein
MLAAVLLQDVSRGFDCSEVISCSDGDMGYEGEGAAQHENEDAEDEDLTPVKLTAATADDEAENSEPRSAPERLFGTQRTVSTIALSNDVRIAASLAFDAPKQSTLRTAARFDSSLLPFATG